MSKAIEGIEDELHRRPTGDVPGLEPMLVEILANVLQGTAGVVAKLLSYEPGTPDTFRVGMPEALLLALRNCGDLEAARLAAEAFLDHHPRATRAPAAPFGAYRAFYVEQRREPGGGWYVLEKQGGENIMPGGEHFASTDAACLVIDLLYEHGLMADPAFVELALKYAAENEPAGKTEG